MAGELDVRAAALDADGADHVRGGVPQLLVRLVGERHLRRDRDRIARVNAHRVEVLDRADDDDVVAAVANHLELELVPAQQGLLDQYLPHRTLGEGPLEESFELGPGPCGAAAVATEGEGRPQDYGEAQVDR